MKLMQNILLLVVLLLIGCTPRAFKRQERKLKVLLRESKNDSFYTNAILDTVRILSKDSLIGRYQFQIGGYFEGYMLILNENGSFKERKWYDVTLIDRILRLQSHYGLWHINEKGVITVKYLLGLKKHRYVAYNYDQRTYLVLRRGVAIFSNRIKQRSMNKDSENFRPGLDSTAIIKTVY